jgi:protein-disulfide isomerase-like protein with CxxC motif
MNGDKEGQTSKCDEITDQFAKFRQEMTSKFDQRVASLHVDRQSIISDITNKIENDLKVQVQQLGKKVTMLIDIQRKKYKEFEDMVAKTNVRFDALNKRDLKR